MTDRPTVPGPRRGDGVLAPEAPEDAFTRGLRGLLAARGIDPEGEDVADTPARWVRALREMTAGYGVDVGAILARQFTLPHADEMIAVVDVPFVSLCARHLLPFAGTAAIAYVPAPGARVVGLSKLPRLLDAFAARLQSQEHITVQVTGALDTNLETLGSACVLRAAHGCMAYRGVRKPGASMVTSSLTGIFREDGRARAEFMDLAKA